jgi:hypothetical protein
MTVRKLRELSLMQTVINLGRGLTNRTHRWLVDKVERWAYAEVETVLMMFSANRYAGRRICRVPRTHLSAGVLTWVAANDDWLLEQLLATCADGDLRREVLEIMDRNHGRFMAPAFVGV